VKEAGPGPPKEARTFQPVAVGYDSRNVKLNCGEFFTPPPNGRLPAGQVAEVVRAIPKEIGSEVT
jgi:hypothetical protein